MRLFLNGSVYFTNKIYDFLLGVKRQRLISKEKIKKKELKVYLSNWGHHSSLSFIFSLITINFLLIIGFCFGWKNLFLEVIIAGVISYFLLFLYVEKNDFHKKEYYSKSFGEIGLQSCLCFLGLLIIPLISLARII
jgi:hypothetical protein